MDDRRQTIVNARIITPDELIDNGSVIVVDGRIKAVTQGRVDGATIDARGCYVSPGFIDLHVHGGAGHDFMDNDVEGFLGIARFHARHGTTAMTPTTLSSGQQALLDTLTTYNRAAPLNRDGAQFLGVHIEGPYFAMTQKGAQDPRYIKPPDEKEYRAILEHSDKIVRWSIAPEMPGALELGRLLKGKGIIPSIAHTDATYEEVVKAFESGYTHMTHFYSAMSGIMRRNGYRYAGVIESGYLIDDMTVEVIADGIHVPPPLLRLVYKIKGPRRTALVTDAMRGAGLPPGETVLGRRDDGTKVVVADGVAWLPDRSAFAGSVATADRLVRTVIQEAGIPLMDAVRMITATPAEIMGVDKGRIRPGSDADLVIFDENIDIRYTIIGGRIIYDANA
ncbi:MAG TPA: N-acetylglucosamine-6-phosphate deacetylase [Dinghuibacter sp.]|uniref:N-acetylglucosamine-6-phosphate deacetylase n=1 Tax=Dinghuibacter sp. TaxID=2024697 RepID=UPI002C0048C1|nr:N-acetylglucosamine-6-phosphate deacetylase [Dinghuibacter sp.]HTJ11305.1 N-acetylglucosamine-6-phosphate deacetylase [Dinghuibacter sp.]